jgi:hypothetical protein
MWEPDDQHGGGVVPDGRGLARLRARVSTQWPRCCALGCPVAQEARLVTSEGKKLFSGQIREDL